MKHHFSFFDTEALGTNEIALLVAATVLFIFTIPSVLGHLFFRRHVHLTVIDRHRNNLRASSVRAGRVQQNIRQTGQFPSVAGLFCIFFPADLFKQKKRLLRAAGFSNDRSLVIFLFIKGVSLAVLCISSLFFMILPLSEMARHWCIFLSGIGLFVFFGSDFFLHFKRGKRLKRLERGLPDCLDLLVICAEAGLSLDAGLKRVAEEFIEAIPELSEELLLTSVELNFLPDRRQALVNLAFRADVPAFRGVTTALIQTEKYGTPLAQALRTLSSEFREARLLDAEEKAARLPAILTVPMICFILPALFVVLAGPAFISVFDSIG